MCPTLPTKKTGRSRVFHCVGDDIVSDPGPACRHDENSSTTHPRRSVKRLYALGASTISNGKSGNQRCRVGPGADADDRTRMCRTSSVQDRIRDVHPEGLRRLAQACQSVALAFQKVGELLKNGGYKGRMDKEDYGPGSPGFPLISRTPFSWFVRTRRTSSYRNTLRSVSSQQSTAPSASQVASPHSPE